MIYFKYRKLSKQKEYLMTN